MVTTKPSAMANYLAKVSSGACRCCRFFARARFTPSVSLGAGKLETGLGRDTARRRKGRSINHLRSPGRRPRATLQRKVSAGFSGDQSELFRRPNERGHLENYGRAAGRLAAGGIGSLRHRHICRDLEGKKVALTDSPPAAAAGGAGYPTLVFGHGFGLRYRRSSFCAGACRGG